MTRIARWVDEKAGIRPANPRSARSSLGRHSFPTKSAPAAGLAVSAVQLQRNCHDLMQRLAAPPAAGRADLDTANASTNPRHQPANDQLHQLKSHNIFWKQCLHRDSQNRSRFFTAGTSTAFLPSRCTSKTLARTCSKAHRNAFLDRIQERVLALSSPQRILKWLRSLRTSNRQLTRHW
jgi:hypothetical protein